MNLAVLLVLFTLGLALDNATALGTSFVTKSGNGFERLVVSIDERLALPPLSGSSSSSPLSSSGTLTSSSGSASATASGGGQTGLKGATQECQKVLEQLKVKSSKIDNSLHAYSHFYFFIAYYRTCHTSHISKQTCFFVQYTPLRFFIDCNFVFGVSFHLHVITSPSYHTLPIVIITFITELWYM